MLQIRQEQIYGLLKEDEAFARWYMWEFMPRHLPEYHFSAIHKDSKQEMILQGRAYARRFHLEEAPSHIHFITLMFKIGPNFFEFPGFHDALTSRRVHESDVIDALYRVSTADAERAIKGADDRYWWPAMIPTEQKHEQRTGKRRD